jgi:hypothetical protein
MTKAWLEMNGDELWLGSASDGQAAYVRVSSIDVIRDDVNSAVACTPSFSLACYSLRPVDVFNAIRWYRKELAEGRAPGTHVIEGARDVEVQDWEYRVWALPAGKPPIKGKTESELTDDERASIGLSPRPPVVNIELPNADSITGGKSIKDTLRDMGVEDDDD